MTSCHLAALLLSLGLAACVSASGSSPPATEPNGSVMSWQMPADISRAERDPRQWQQTVLAYISPAGFVRGTPQALATVGRPLPAASGPNRTVEACRGAVQIEAAKLGARQVEAVSAGRERRDTRGLYRGPVLIRVTYDQPGATQVRLATLTCIVNRRGTLVRAFV